MVSEAHGTRVGRLSVYFRHSLKPYAVCAIRLYTQFCYVFITYTRSTQVYYITMIIEVLLFAVVYQSRWYEP